MSEQLPKSTDTFLNSNEDKENVLNGVSSSEKYIIHLNDTLQVKNTKNIKTIQNLENHIEELEEDIESLEKKHEYNKDLLKNFHEMTKWHAKISEYRLDMFENTRKSVNYFKYKALRHLRYLEALMIGFATIFYEIYPLSYTMNVIVMLIVIDAFQKSILINLNLPVFNAKQEKIDTINEEIKKTTASQDYIREFISKL